MLIMPFKTCTFNSDTLRCIDWSIPQGKAQTGSDCSPPSSQCFFLTRFLVLSALKWHKSSLQVIIKWSK